MLLKTYPLARSTALGRPLLASRGLTPKTSPVLRSCVVVRGEKKDSDKGRKEMKGEKETAAEEGAMAAAPKTQKPRNAHVTVLSGFTGSGKAELAAYIAATHKVEPLLVKDEQSKGKEGEGKKDKEKEREKDKGSKKRRPARLSVVDEMQEDDLVAGLAKVYGEGAADHVLLLSADAADPEELAEFLSYALAEPLSGTRVHIDSLVTSVHLPSLLGLLTDPPILADACPELADQWGDSASVADPLVKQIEFADMVVVHGLSDVSDVAELEASLAVLRRLNPLAEIRVMGTELKPWDVVGQGLFCPRDTMERAGWFQALARNSEDGYAELHAAGGVETTHYLSNKIRLVSAIYRASRPFHPERLASALEEEVPGLVRSKGFFQLATRPGQMGLWESTGQSWTGSLAYRMSDSPPAPPHEEQEEGLIHVGGLALNKETLEVVRTGSWQSVHFLGLNLDFASVRASLDTCLLSDEEMAGGAESWAEFSDPLPDWPEEDEGEAQGEEGGHVHDHEGEGHEDHEEGLSDAADARRSMAMAALGMPVSDESDMDEDSESDSSDEEDEKKGMEGKKGMKDEVKKM